MPHNYSYSNPVSHFPVRGITQPQLYGFSNNWPMQSLTNGPQSNAFTIYNPTNPLEQPYTVTPNNNLLASLNPLGQLGQLRTLGSLLSPLVSEQTKMYSKNGLNIKLSGSTIDVDKAAKMLDYVAAIGGLPNS